MISGIFAAIGCSTSGDDNEHGPSFAFDGGAAEGDATASDAGGDAPASTDGPSIVVESGTDAPASTDGPVTVGDGGGCSSTLGIVAGDGTTLSGATFTNGGPWNVASIPNGSALSPPAIISSGPGFRAVTRAANDLLLDTAYTATWSAATGIAGTTSRDKPGIASLGGALHLVYWGSDSKLYHGTFTQTWDAANDPVGGAGALQDFGPSGAGVAAAGTSLVIAFDGSDHFLYARNYASSMWQPAQQQPMTSVYLPATPPAPAPTILALTGGSADLLIVYLDQGAQPFIYWAVRDATSKTWSTALPIDTDAATNESPALASMSGGRAVMTWRGTNGMAYFNTYDPANTPPWKQHAFLVTSTTAIASRPSVATGVCGDDAVAAYPLAGGAVQVTRLRGATWSTPENVGSLTNLGFSSIASSP